MTRWLLLGLLLVGCGERYRNYPARAGDVRWIRQEPQELTWIKTGECSTFTRAAEDSDPERTGLQISGIECQEIYRLFYPNK